MPKLDDVNLDAPDYSCRICTRPVDPERARKVVERSKLHVSEAPILCPECAAIDTNPTEYEP